jgi:gliding motility-associated-like protein
LDAPKDTIASMHLTMSTTATTVDLSWTLVNSPELPSSNGPGLYQIFREDPIGVWSYVTSTPSLNYSEPIIWCNDSVNYRIELSDNLPCTSTSNIVGDVLSIIDPPEPQRIDSVSVDKTTGLAVIGWSPNPQPSVIEYIIEQNPDLIAWGQLHTAVGYNNTFWENPASQASSESEYYRLKATNNCNQTGTSDEYHQTIYLTTVADGCNRAVNLEWNEYVNWPGGVEKYEILVSKDGGAIQKIGETADTIGTFTHTGVEELATYCYCVRAIQNAPTRFTSTSNESCTFVYVPKRPDYSYHYNTTVQPGNTGVETYFFVDSVAGYLGYEIQRGTSPDDLSYQWFIPYDADTRYYSYTDAGSRPESTSYYYQVIGVDSCEQFADTLNMNRTIYLEAEANLDRTNSLQWNGYEGWNGPIIGYNIFRSVDGTFDYLNTVAPTELTYLDNVEEIIVGEGNFCYYIEAIEGTDVPVGNPPATFMERSRSNEACAKQHPNVFMPNAFMPEGINNVFKPVTRFVDTDSYLFQIYDRWGKRVFESTDPELGWNGNSGSNQLPQGAYVYYVHFVSSNGQTYTKRGSVTLIR